MKRAKRLEVLFEFLVFGIIIGIVEDVIAVKLTTGEPITGKVIWIVVLIAIPFAIIGEIVADNVNFTRLLERLLGKRILYGGGGEGGEKVAPQRDEAIPR